MGEIAMKNVNAGDFDLSGKKLGVLIPIHSGYMHVDTVVSICKTLLDLQEYGVQVQVEMKVGSALIEKARSELTQDAVEKGFDHYLFVDGDMAWDSQDIPRLLSWNTLPEHPFVGGVYCTKDDDPRFHYTFDTELNPGRVTQNDFGLIKAFAIPGGFIMARHEELKAVMENSSWYIPSRGDRKGIKTYLSWPTYISDDHIFYGEDIAFCQNIKKAGFDLWIDPLLQLRHIGTKVFDHQFHDYLISKIKAAQPVKGNSVDD